MKTKMRRRRSNQEKVEQKLTLLRFRVGGGTGMKGERAAWKGGAKSITVRREKREGSAVKEKTDRGATRRPYADSFLDLLWEGFQRGERERAEPCEIYGEGKERGSRGKRVRATPGKVAV